MAKPQRFIRLLLDDQTDLELRELAEHLRTTRSAIVRQAVSRMHRAENPPRSKESQRGERAA